MKYTVLDYKGFENDLVMKSTNVLDNGLSYVFAFDNGYGASVIKHRYSYGNENDLFELAILDKNGEITYDTYITDDVIGWLANDEVLEIFKQIQSL